MVTSQLSLYNGALALLGSAELASLTESRASRRALDTAWDNGAIVNCLEEGYFTFAIRSVELTYDASIDPDWGYVHAFDKNESNDYIRTSAVCSDPYFNSPITEYSDEAGYIWCDLDTIYFRYVSSHTSYGYNYAEYPETFSRFVEAYLADKIAPRITQSDAKIESIRMVLKKAKMNACSKDAMNNPTKFMPLNTWSKARLGGGGSTRDGGSRTTF
jgi:hypothetical protein